MVRNWWTLTLAGRIRRRWLLFYFIFMAHNHFCTVPTLSLLNIEPWGLCFQLGGIVCGSPQNYPSVRRWRHSNLCHTSSYFTSPPPLLTKKWKSSVGEKGLNFMFPPNDYTQGKIIFDVTFCHIPLPCHVKPCFWTTSLPLGKCYIFWMTPQAKIFGPMSQSLHTSKIMSMSFLR